LGDRLDFRGRDREAVVGDLRHRVRIVVAEMAAALIHTVLVEADVIRGIVIQARTILQAGQVHAFPRTHESDDALISRQSFRPVTVIIHRSMNSL